MSKQPRALELAEELVCVTTCGEWDSDTKHASAALLRSQHELIGELVEAMHMVQVEAIDKRGDDFNLNVEQWAKFNSAISKAEEQQ